MANFSKPEQTLANSIRFATEVLQHLAMLIAYLKWCLRCATVGCIIIVMILTDQCMHSVAKLVVLLLQVDLYRAPITAAPITAFPRSRFPRKSLRYWCTKSGRGTLSHFQWLAEVSDNSRAIRQNGEWANFLQTIFALLQSRPQFWYELDSCYTQ